MTEEITNGEDRKKRIAKSGATGLWGRWKSRNTKKKLEDLVKATVAAGISGGLALGTIGYIRANDAQNTIRDNQAAWLQDLKGAQEAALNAQNIATKANEAAAAAQTTATEAKANADAAQKKADDSVAASKAATERAVEAQAVADQAKADAIAAQNEANVAKTDADAAKLVADRTAAELITAQNDINTSKETIIILQAAADKAAADIAAAQSSANAAQTTADKAATAAQTAQAAADDAKSDAAFAQATADKAVEDAADAQAAADAAQQTADDALAIAQQALANAATAQAAADAAQATANEALGRTPTMVTFPDQAIPDNVGTFDDVPAGSLLLQPGRYLLSYGGTFTTGPWQMRLRIQNGAVFSGPTGCMAAGFRYVDSHFAFIEISVPTTILLEHDSCAANIPAPFTGPFIRYIKIS